MSGRTFTRDQALTILSATPTRLAELTVGVEAEQLWARPAPEEWSAVEAPAHLRACADAWGGCIAAIVAHDHPTLRAINPRTWIEQTDYRDQEFEDSLRAFARQRAELLAMLESLPSEGWSRAATVTGAGKPLERTVLFYTEWLARHERPHVKQIERIVAAMRNEPAPSDKG